MVAEVIEWQREHASPEKGQPPNRIGDPGLPNLGGQVAQFYLDWAKRERRPGNRADFIDLIKFGDVLHDGGTMGHSLLVTDAPAMVEPPEACALLMQYARRPGHTYPHYVEQFDYLMEMGEIWEGRKDRFLVGGIFITSPLRACERAADFMARRIEMGMDCGCGTMACAGASVPVTLAGAIVVTAAELLGVWTAIKAMRADAPLRGSVAAGSVDMRTGNATYCSPEAMLLNFGTIEFFRRLCGVRIGLAGASDYTDAKLPGLAAAMEKAFKAMTVAAFTGVQPPAGQGMLESGKTLSPEQLLIEREVTQHIRQLAKPLRVDPETLAQDTIDEVGLGIGWTYLESEHTLRNFRDALWHPTLLDRGVWQGFEIGQQREREMIDRAHETFLDMLSQYVPPEPDPDKLAAVRKVIERAKKELG